MDVVRVGTPTVILMAVFHTIAIIRVTHVNVLAGLFTIPARTTITIIINPAARLDCQTALLAAYHSCNEPRDVLK